MKLACPCPAVASSCFPPPDALYSPMGHPLPSRPRVPLLLSLLIQTSLPAAFGSCLSHLPYSS